MSNPTEPTSGSIPFAIGIPSIVRIPIPGTNGLCIEFRSRGPIPKTGSTSTLFFQDISGKRHLRLDFGHNPRTKTINYHWNQTGTRDTFGIKDHTPAGHVGATTHKAAKYYRYAGRTLVVLGATVDIVSVVVSSMPIRRASEVVSGWAFAWDGCKAVGAGSAAIGSVASPIGTAIGGVGA